MALLLLRSTTVSVLLCINLAVSALYAQVAQTPGPIAGISNKPLESADNSYFGSRVCSLCFHLHKDSF